MSDQPHQPYGGQEPPAWPAQPGRGFPPGFEEPSAAEQTQQWQGQTWETRLQPPIDPTTPPPSPSPGGGYGGQPQPGPSYGGQPYGGEPQAGQPPYAGQPQAGQPPYGGQPYAGQSYGGGPQAGQPYPGRPQPQPEHQYAAPPHPYQQAAQPYPQPQAAAAYAAAPAARPHEPAAAPEPAPPAGDGPGYGPATLAGNARITDAQRARAEGRSPIIDPGMRPALLTALLGLLLAGAAAIGTYALLLPLVALQAVTAAGWFRLNGMWPARQGIALGFLGALVADVAMLASDRSPAALLGSLGVWVLLTLVLQLRSHADPDERMYGLMATVVAAALAIIAGGYLAADTDAVTVGGIAVAAAAVVRALPLPAPAAMVAAVLAAAGAGAAAGGMTGLGTSGALLGAGAAVCALIGHRAAAYDYPSRFVHFTAGVALPLAAAAPAVYVLGRLLG
ncbi:hypothetical protein [Streptomyces tagetis]|uniref:Uncharacterized protein n=1 Tax=Streptomyces tagetis TaxID=2820809 RepID=A0A940XPF7_9ACTN|nr:hypothetical protein [Streptomyces sp. RG38]MBQ0830807.1 hypothetical protein [Streptomyces sp. RG38]